MYTAEVQCKAKSNAIVLTCSARPSVEKSIWRINQSRLHSDYSRGLQALASNETQHSGVKVEVAVRAWRRRAAMTRLYTMPMRQGVSSATLLRFRQHGLDTTAAPTRPLPAQQQPHDCEKQRPAASCLAIIVTVSAAQSFSHDKSAEALHRHQREKRVEVPVWLFSESSAQTEPLQVPYCAVNAEQPPRAG